MACAIPAFATFYWLGRDGSDFAGGDQSVRGRHLGAGRYPCRRCQPPRWRWLFKGGAALAPLAGVDIFVFDKTGALTTGKASVTSVVALDGNERSFLSLLAGLEAQSEHHSAAAIRAEAANRSLQPAEVRDVITRPRAGIVGDDGKINYGQAILA